MKTLPGDLLAPIVMDGITHVHEGLNIENWPKTHGGLTKREYFAAMALLGLISSKDVSEPFAKLELLAVRHAEKLIEELNK